MFDDNLRRQINLTRGQHVMKCIVDQSVLAQPHAGADV